MTTNTIKICGWDLENLCFSHSQFHVALYLMVYLFEFVNLES